MPKVSIEETDSQKKRAPRKRAVRRTITSDEAPAPRRRVASTEASSTSTRKAPTRIEYTDKKRTPRKSLTIFTTVFILVVAGAAWIGFSDKGQINVNAKITERNQQQANEPNEDGSPQTIVVPVQNSSPSVPNGGFRGRGAANTNVTSEPVVQETATSTEESATSTEPVPEETTEDTSTEVVDQSSSEVESTEGGTPELAQ